MKQGLNESSEQKDTNLYSSFDGRNMNQSKSLT